MLRSPHAHARIRAIDVSAARKAPGVVGVFTAADLGAANAPLPIYAPHPALPVPCRLRPLATDVVRFVGEPLVAVVADDPYRAWDALDLIEVEYEPLPAIVDVEAALAQDAHVLHAEIGSNVVAEWRQRVGDADAALRSRGRRRAHAPPARARHRASPGAARARRALGRRRAHRVGRDPARAPASHRLRRSVRDPGRACPRDRAARRGRGLRDQGDVLPRVHRGRGARAPARPALEVDRDAARAHARRLRGARSDPRRRDRRHA